jgi:hypothetical protein
MGPRSRCPASSTGARRLRLRRPASRRTVTRRPERRRALPAASPCPQAPTPGLPPRAAAELERTHPGPAATAAAPGRRRLLPRPRPPRTVRPRPRREIRWTVEAVARWALPRRAAQAARSGRSSDSSDWHFAAVPARRGSPDTNAGNAPAGGRQGERRSPLTVWVLVLAAPTSQPPFILTLDVNDLLRRLGDDGHLVLTMRDPALRRSAR